jgi:hypothetical protein
MINCSYEFEDEKVVFKHSIDGEGAVNIEIDCSGDVDLKPIVDKLFDFIDLGTQVVFDNSIDETRLLDKQKKIYAVINSIFEEFSTEMASDVLIEEVSDGSN